MVQHGAAKEPRDQWYLFSSEHLGLNIGFHHVPNHTKSIGESSCCVFKFSFWWFFLSIVTIVCHSGMQKLSWYAPFSDIYNICNEWYWFYYD
jgi:hypothetical protein